MPILCPKCGTYNPPIKTFCHSHYGEQCKSILGVKRIFFGLFTKNIYCNFIGLMDEDDDWHYCHKDSEGRIILDKESDIYSIESIKEVKF